MSKVKFLVAVMLSVLVAACSEEENLSQADKTGFHVSLTEDVKVDSRSTPEEIGKPLASQFNLKITNQATGNTVHDALFKGKEGETEFIPAAAGTYDIEATYGDNPVLALDDPYYKGMAKDVVLEDGESKTVSLNCTVANALTSVVFSDDFAKQFSDYGVEVLVSGNRTTIKGKESAYYRAGSTPSFTFKGITTKGEIVEQLLQNDEFNKSATFAAKAHCKISLTIGAVVPGIRVEINKVEVDSVTVSETIPMEWLPKPKVTATGFDANNTLTFVETEQKQAALNLNLASALQDIRFKFNFQDEQFTALNRDTGYLYSNPADKDIINTTFGISLAENKLDLNNLIAKLQTNAGVTTTNTIEIDAKANNRWSSEVKEDEETPNLKYTLTCNKPEFSIDAYPGNIWTKEFTVNALREEQVTSGDFTTLSSDMTYQYSVDGETNWTALNDGMRQDKLTPGTTYYIRGLYRSEVAGEVAEVRTYPVIALENGDMEDWQEEDGNGHYNLWLLGDNTNQRIWSTKNMETTNGENLSYASASGVVRSNEKVSENYSALIRTIGYGVGNTWISPSWGGEWSSVCYNSAIGELFLGSYENNAVYGISYNSHPTKLKFFYKYSPYIDTDKGIGIVELRNEEKNQILFSQTISLPKQSTFKEVIIPLENSVIDLEITKLSIIFKSGESTDIKKARTRDGIKEHYGSELYIDDVELVYDK